jgi:hypothetical protein
LSSACVRRGKRRRCRLYTSYSPRSVEIVCRRPRARYHGNHEAGLRHTQSDALIVITQGHCRGRQRAHAYEMGGPGRGVEAKPVTVGPDGTCMELAHQAAEATLYLGASMDCIFGASMDCSGSCLHDVRSHGLSNRAAKGARIASRATARTTTPAMKIRFYLRARAASPARRMQVRPMGALGRLLRPHDCAPVSAASRGRPRSPRGGALTHWRFSRLVNGCFRGLPRSLVPRFGGSRSK